MPTPVNVIGSDGYSPIYQPENTWKIWGYHDIYKGQNYPAKDKYIPNQYDWVAEPETGNIYMVSHIDPYEYTATLVPKTIQQNQINYDIMSSTHDNYRVYIDKTLEPYTLAVDGFMRVYSPSANYARIYKGRFIDSSNIISKVYDGSGNITGTDLELKMVEYNSHDNYGVKYIPACHTTHELNDGDDAIVVVFDSDNKVIAKIHCIIENTSYVSTALVLEKYVTQISLLTQFMDVVNDTKINYPVNLDVSAFTPLAVVHYSDGTTTELAIDGNKVSLFGLDQFTSNIVGHNVPIVLSYKLGPNETALGVTAVNGSITRDYDIFVAPANLTYQVQLYVFPKWNSSQSRYDLTYYLMNADRDMLFEVTNLVSLAITSPAFNGTNYSSNQALQVSINLGDVLPSYGGYVHTQSIRVRLREAASGSGNTLWDVIHKTPSGTIYGTNLKATRVAGQTKHVKIDNGYTTVQQFLTNTYNKSQPILLNGVEIDPPVPTHIQVLWNNQDVFVPIEQFTNTFIFNTNVTLHGNIVVVFYTQTPTGYLKVGICGMTVR